MDKYMGFTWIYMDLQILVGCMAIFRGKNDDH